MEDLLPYALPYTLSTLFYIVCAFGLAECFFYGNFPNHYNSLSKAQKLEWLSNFGSSINSLLAGLGALIGLFLPLALEQQFSIIRYVVISITGYSLGDTLFRIYHRKTLDKPSFQNFLIFHHILAAVAVQVAVMHKEALQAKFLFILMELSTIFINIRSMLLDAKIKRSSLLYQTMSLTMMGMYFVSRIAPIPMEYYLIVYRCLYIGDICSPETAFFMGLNSIPYNFLTIANLYWFKKIVFGLIIHLKKMKDPKGLDSIENELFGDAD
ncbi:uncharacterized protein LOC134857263 [Symsagittifera roscoffensis]|uniref:uncharacterized protein LOC134857263 n=1 Tax=Symsagittifera roscoffensis TaxID=84072 RepID=UPI00307B2972